MILSEHIIKITNFFTLIGSYFLLITTKYCTLAFCVKYINKQARLLICWLVKFNYFNDILAFHCAACVCISVCVFVCFVLVL